MFKILRVRIIFGSSNIEKTHAVMAQSKLNLQKIKCSDRF
jgi:hypothetical protein